MFSTVGINLMLASLAGGEGVVWEKGLLSNAETFMKMELAGVGIGLGVKDFGAVFVFSSKDNLRAFVESEGCRRQIR